MKSLKSQSHTLSDQRHQLDVLNGGQFANGNLATFKTKLTEQGMYPLRPVELEIFQMNVGYMCNQTCKHCHVDAGPDRKEIMQKDTFLQCLKAISASRVKSIDLTGGAPEMNPHFRWFITELRKFYSGEIIVRCNLTIILANPKYHDLPDFFKANNIRVVSSLPFYNADKTDRQRGSGVFEKSIQALKLLNAVGYGRFGSGLVLDLVYNPSGAFLPADQSQLEKDFKTELHEHFEIDFNNLLSITNLPISRFLDYLIDTDNLDDYMTELVYAFNPVAAEGVMCRNTISIDYQGNIYDCDFNQMLGLRVDHPVKHVKGFTKDLINRNIKVGQHCYGCTAGEGSSCQGATA
ncbi:MAG: arsenosugar biosynthesis radical SAM protein ArsS [Cyclobacteriaceae bacterium]